MALELNGTTGVSLVQDGVVTAADLASGAITSAALPAGSVLQVVTATTASRFNTTSTSFVATSIQASITPSSTSSKILIGIMSCYSTEASGRTQYVTIYRDASVNLGGSDGMAQNYNNGGAQRSGLYLSVLDSPNTTSSVTYALAHKSGGGTVEIVPFNNALSSVVLMEIAG